MDGSGTMETRFWLRRGLALVRIGFGLGLVAAASLGVQTGGLAASSPGYSLANVGPYGGEPSIVSDSAGQLFDTTPSGGTLTYTSTDRGKTWRPVTTADPNSGDDCLATDQSNAVYLCNLAGSEGVAPLQADVWKSVDQGTTWTHGAGALPQCGTSCSPFGVDRDWVATSILKPLADTSTAEVVLMYHDFSGPSQIWVNSSTDGGATFGPPKEVLASPAVTPGAVAGTLVAQGYTFCNTVPAGVQTVRPRLPHAGRIFVAWIAADLAQNATGCNVSMLQSFHTLWISYSDDNGLTWTAQQAFDAGIGHDASTPFVGFTTDNQGNPYFAFANNLNSNPATCSAESAAGTVQSDTSCEYDMYVVWSKNGGTTWDGGERQSRQLPAPLPVEPLRSAIDQPDFEPGQRNLDDDPNHDDADAHRRHLQPRHCLPGAELESQPARLHHGDPGSIGMRPHRLRR